MPYLWPRIGQIRPVWQFLGALSEPFQSLHSSLGLQQLATSFRQIFSGCGCNLLAKFSLDHQTILPRKGDLNSQQICEATFLPHIDELVQKFSGKKNYLTKLDATQFYFQIELEESSKDICSFSTPLGHYRSNVMLQGDANAQKQARM